MKNLFFSLGISLAVHALLPYQSMAQTNLIANGDFETQYATVRPSQELNIKGNRGSNVDELPSWRVPSPGSGPNPVSINATFLATNAINSDVNPNTNSTFYGPFPPHNNSTGCVGLKRSLFYPAYDGLITQQVALSPGHKYQFGYYVMKRPGAGYASKFAFNVINSSSTPALSANNATSSFEPAPAVTVTTDLITSTDWTYVTGSFIAQTPPANTQPWIVIGYDRSAEQTDPNAGGATSGNEVYILDDVSLVDMGCPLPTTPEVYPPNWTCDSPAFTKVVMANYDPTATYTITTTGGIRNSPTGIYAENTSQGTRWVIQLLRTTAGEASTITIASTNACGASSLRFDVIAPICTGGGGGGGGEPEANLVAYPNPATEFMMIPVGVENVTLLNSKGKAVLRPDASGKLNVQGLPAGLYNLQMRRGSKLINQRIEIKH